MSENVKTEIKTVKGLPGSVARFKRSRDGVLIYVYPRDKRNESRDAAIQRVTSHNGGVKEGSLEYCE
jgi:hypothetical protein